MTAPDYASLIDAPTRAFIRRTESFYPPETASFPVEEQRRIYGRMCAAFAQPRPPGLHVRDEAVGGVSCRIFAGAGPRVVYCHGGGFVVGGLDSHDDICAGICDRTGLEVVAVDYRLAPEHPHPAALEDVLAVIGALPGRLVLAGDSAGGCLAAAACHVLRDPRILGQVLIYPLLGGDTGRGSYVTHADAPMLTRADVAYYAGIRGAAKGDPTALPLDDGDFTGLPMTLAVAAECDPLADDATDYAARIRAAGGRARAVTDAGLVHGWLRARHSAPRAAQSFQRITDTIAAFARSEWPYTEVNP
ncbi:alpha/beta hydrolase [Pseudogemmobacter humi]|uniref:Carboxylesterase NlhH n=1 Tax=Pseudogemmobacter humi TaxID=2483812 RepID=A0A3P5X7S8_9RHOB|nr:alpha/beta hydrolase [Pseudogemmobacter humi]VDC27326.1 Carboxylesterase NlhH [Pseudogemmobacter humi]